MIAVVKDSWALLLGLLLLMVGNGLQGTLLGVRGALEGMTPGELSWVMSAYFAGFLFGSRAAPEMLRRVGHVRVFAALASLISAAFILYAAAPSVGLWAAMRLLVGFCFAGVYVTAESWLNERADNDTRGQAMSAYLIVQMGGLVAAQFLLNLADPGGYLLFILISVLVSISFAPILLSVTPTPAFQAGERLTLRELWRVSPLAAVGAPLLGAAYSALLGMSAVYGAEAGLSVAQISLFVSAVFAGGLVLQWPIGWLSDRMDRRRLIVALTSGGAAGGFLGAFAEGWFPLILAAGAAVGAAAGPLYGLLIAHAADHLPRERMAAASAGLVFLNGAGAVLGPLGVGWLLAEVGPRAFFLFLFGMMAFISVYGLYRMSRRAAPGVEAQGPYARVSPSATAFSVGAAQEGARDRRAEATEPEAA
jgi:MFS family permease